MHISIGFSSLATRLSEPRVNFSFSKKAPVVKPTEPDKKVPVIQKGRRGSLLVLRDGDYLTAPGNKLKHSF